MRVLIREHDWSASPLGPVSGWPQSLRTAVDIMLSSRYAMFVWWGSELISLYNDAYRQFLGKKHPQSLGQPARQVWSEIWEQIGPRTRAVLERGESTYDEALLLMMERFGYPEETYFTFAYSPLRDDQGAVGGIFCAVTEDTRRVIGERRMGLLGKVAAIVADTHTPEEVCAAAAGCLAQARDVPFALLYLNDRDGKSSRLAASSPGCPPALRGESGIDRQADGALWPFHRTMTDNAPMIVEGLASRIGRKADGVWDRPPDRAVIVPLREPSQAQAAGFLVAGLNPYLPFEDTYRGFLGLLADQIARGIARAHAYQEEHRRAEALAEIDRAKTAFFSNISHEFRTPLTLLLGPIEEAALDESVPAAVRAELEIAQRNAVRLLRLVNSLLDFSRIEAGRLQACYEPTNLAALTRDLSSTFRSAMERAGLRFRVECADLSEPVYLDREMWEKIVLNLLSNAFKYTLKGAVTVSLSEGAQGAALEVSDTGSGIPEHELPRLFERFHRVEGSVGRTQEGSGIGLALVQELVRLHGGTLSASSVLGEGTTLRVGLPFGSAHLPADRIKRGGSSAVSGLGAQAFVQEALRWIPASADSTARLPALLEQAPPVEGHRFAGTSGARILLADDNADMRDYVGSLLGAHYEVETVSDGAQALAAARARPPDLILSDVMMPGLDGFGLLQALRADEALSDVPVILLSARAGEEARIGGLEAGADDYLVKPFSARELAARVRAHLALRQARREAMEGLRASDERARALFQQAPGFMCVLTGSEHVFEFTNESYRRLVGGRECIGRRVEEAFPEVREQGFLELLDEVYRTGRPVTRTETALDLRRSPEGPLQRAYVDFIYQPVKGVDGTVSGIFVEGFDVTSRVLAQRQLRRSEQMRQLALDAAGMGTFTWYPEEDRAAADERMLALFGLPPDGSLSLASALSTLIVPEDGARYAAAVARAIDPTGPGTLRAEIRVRPADGGDLRWLNVVGQAFFDTVSARPLHMAGTATDITERKNAEQTQVEVRLALEAAHRQKDEFLAMLAHELRNPLAPIGTAGDMLSLLPQADSRAAAAVAVIRRQVSHLTRLVDDLLDVSRITRGRIELKRLPVDLNAVVAQAVEMMQPRLTEKSHHLTVTTSGDRHPYVIGDFARLVQSIGNLLANAIKYTQPGGEITVLAHGEEASVTVEVTDSGEGIDAELLPRVFDLFVQSDRTLDRSQGGLGIGLAVVRSLIEMHGGQVTVRSAGPGRGSTFAVRLPRIERAAVRDTEGPPAAVTPRRILIVDDNFDAADTLAALLQMQGHQTHSACSAREALQSVLSFRPDVALLDIGLPEMNGYELAERLRALPQLGALRLIALTGYGHAEDRQRGQAAGFDDHLVKPVKLSALDRALQCGPLRSSS
ncbi:MAG: response regulator [Proteobacteria bacterium]|nr:response regulator [Pseudomonadota bacterium]